MQLISMNALCDNDSTLKEEESSFSGPTWPPKPSCSFPSFGCRVLGSAVPVPTRLDHRSRGGIWPCVLCRPIWAGGHAIGDVFVTVWVWLHPCRPWLNTKSQISAGRELQTHW